MFIDGLQYCNWSEKIFKQWRASNLTAVHVTIHIMNNLEKLYPILSSGIVGLKNTLP